MRATVVHAPRGILFITPGGPQPAWSQASGHRFTVRRH